MTDEDIKTLAEVDQRSKSNSHRLDKLEGDVSSLQKEQSAIYKLAASVQVIAEQTKNTSDDVKELSSKIDKQADERIKAERALEDKIGVVKNAPALKQSETAEKVRVAVITAICSGLATTLLYKLLAL